MHTRSPIAVTVMIEGEIEEGIRLLRQTAEFANRASAEVWQFAVEIRELIAVGLNWNHIRCLAQEGLVEVRVETTTLTGSQRCFRPVKNLALVEGACLMLTEAGRAWASSLAKAEETVPDVVSVEVPVWDAKFGELRYRGELLHRYCRKATNQRLILSAFQELGWPSRIDDPLSRRQGTNPKRRRADAIEDLNAGLTPRWFSFHGDGTATGILWRTS